MLLVWIGVIALVIWGLSSLFPRSRALIEPTVLEIVRQRYARGEISREEYLQATETLRVPDQATQPRPLN
jgi:putative membrane protein